jgi:PEP-CTERM motif
MSKIRVFTSILSAVFFLALASSARADVAQPDVVQANKFLEKLIFAEEHDLTIFDSQRVETGYLYAAHFEDNNGRHLGFSIAAFRQGPKLGIVRPQTPAVASQNPEPTAMVLLGTGLAAIAAFARRKNRRRLRL